MYLSPLLCKFLDKGPIQIPTYKEGKQNNQLKHKIEKVNLRPNHVDYLAQYILEEHRLLGHAFHSMQLLLIKEL